MKELREDEETQEEAKQFERCMAKSVLAVATTAVDFIGAKPLALGVVGAARMSGEVMSSIFQGFLGQQVRGISSASSNAVAGAILSGNVGLAASGTTSSLNAMLDGSLSSINGWSFLPIIGTGVAWRDAQVECSR